MATMTATPTATATAYVKLRDGSWGLRGTRLASGQTVTVTRRDGTIRTHQVGRILWTDHQTTLATIAGSAPTRHHSHAMSDGMVRCRHCGRRTPEGDDWCTACGRADYER